MRLVLDIPDQKAPALFKALVALRGRPKNPNTGEPLTPKQTVEYHLIAFLQDVDVQFRRKEALRTIKVKEQIDRSLFANSPLKDIVDRVKQRQQTLPPEDPGPDPEPFIPAGENPDLPDEPIDPPNDPPKRG